MSRDTILASETFDYELYHKRIRGSSCLFCLLANSRSGMLTDEHFIYEDEFSLAVLDRYPTQFGYSLVFPKIHFEHLHLLDESAFLKLQKAVHVVAKGVQAVTRAERIYTACLGSQLLTPHIHYHVVPIRAGLPLEDQQWNALDKSRGILPYSRADFEYIASMIRHAVVQHNSEES